MYEHYISPDGGTPAPDIWAYQPYTAGTVFGTEDGIDADVRWLNPRDAERLRYPTQKPLGLMRRIISSSSNPGDVVLDAFCGCGTTVDAAQELGRRWVGIDITTVAIDLIRTRLEDTHGAAVKSQYEVRGIPRDMEGAHALFEKSHREFERWAVTLVNGTPNTKQVADRGKDGVIRFPLPSKKTGKVLVSVKGGEKLSPQFVRDLVGTVSSEGAEMGLLVTLHEPTSGMVKASNRAGSYEWPVGPQRFPRVQIVTIEELLTGRRRPDMPPALPAYLPARRLTRAIDQMALDV